MPDVAYDRHRELRKIRAFGLTQREHVEQALRRMREPAITGVDQRSALARARGKFCDRTALSMPHLML